MIIFGEFNLNGKFIAGLMTYNLLRETRDHAATA